MSRSLRVFLAASCLLIFFPAGGRPCSFGYGVLFWNTHAPGPASSDYLAGDLGILAPTRHTRLPGPLLEIVAYRHLAGLSLADEDRAALTELLEPKWEAHESALESWEIARSAQATPRSYDAVTAVRKIRDESEHYVYYRSVVNCYPDAFATAVATLEDRRRRYDSAELAEWLRGQDSVFFACRGSGASPRAPLASWSPLLRSDRAYQIAATDLYALRFDDALTRFRRIAGDASSPWRAMSSYLVARTLFRRMEPGDAEEAQAALEAILDDSSLVEMHDAADLLLGYYLARSEPAARRRELASRMVASRLPPRSSQLLIDYGYLLGRREEGEGAIEEVTEWIQAFQGGTAEKALAADRWSERRSLAWLVLAAASAEAGDALVPEILEATERVASTSPGYATLVFHRGRLLAELGRYEDARALLDEMLEDPTVSVSDENRVLALLTRHAPDLETFLLHAPMRAARIGYHDGGVGSIPSGRDGDVFDVYRHRRLMFSDDIVAVLNWRFPTQLLLQAAASETLPAPLRLQVARTAWVRAVVTDDAALAESAATLLIQLEAEPRPTELQLYLAARPGPDRRFAAALHLLRNPKWGPWLEHFRDLSSQRLWCGGEIVRRYSSYASQTPPAFVDPGQAAWAGLDELESGTRLLGRVVFDRRATHPRDDRVPEALHLLVRATRRACGFESQKDISRTAFRLLHDEYPASGWTAKTPYWFD